MEYIVQRGSKVGSFQNVLMKGLAQDGGLLFQMNGLKLTQMILNLI